MLPSSIPPHNQCLSFHESINHAKFSDDIQESAQNVLLWITLAGKTYSEERDEKWNGSYCLKKGHKMLQKG